MSDAALFKEIFEKKVFAVTGVSRNPMKFGHRVYHFLKDAGYRVYAVNPNADCIIDDICYASLGNIPATIDCVVTVTQPHITATTLQEAEDLDIPYAWMQPGSEPAEAKGDGKLLTVGGGPCIMVEHIRLHR